ncbi:hypothetical protein KR018_008641 [Drosophila ironensis]|nr:hypothetical protein KR018_008641 [Drosophila ironensis]
MDVNAFNELFNKVHTDIPKYIHGVNQTLDVCKMAQDWDYNALPRKYSHAYKRAMKSCKGMVITCDKCIKKMDFAQKCLIESGGDPSKSQLLLDAMKSACEQQEEAAKKQKFHENATLQLFRLVRHLEVLRSRE